MIQGNFSLTNYNINIGRTKILLIDHKEHEKNLKDNKACLEILEKELLDKTHNLILPWVSESYPLYYLDLLKFFLVLRLVEVEGLLKLIIYNKQRKIKLSEW